MNYFQECKSILEIPKIQLMEEDSPFLESQSYSLQRLLITACNSLKHRTLGLHFKCNLILKTDSSSQSLHQ